MSHILSLYAIKYEYVTHIMYTMCDGAHAMYDHIHGMFTMHDFVYGICNYISCTTVIIPYKPCMTVFVACLPYIDVLYITFGRVIIEKIPHMVVHMPSYRVWLCS